MRKSINIILDVVLFGALLTYFTIFCWVNKNFEWISATNEDFQTRFLYKRIAENILSIGNCIYIIGNIISGYFMVMKDKYISFKAMVLYYFRQILLLIICTVPFIIFDSESLNDYIFVVAEIGGSLLVVFGIIGLYKMMHVIMKKKIKSGA